MKTIFRRQFFSAAQASKKTTLWPCLHNGEWWLIEGYIGGGYTSSRNMWQTDDDDAGWHYIVGEPHRYLLYPGEKPTLVECEAIYHENVWKRDLFPSAICMEKIMRASAKQN